MTVEYSSALAEEICERLALGESLRSICRDSHMPDERAVRFWVLKDYNGFAPHYARAREMQMDHFAEEITTLADEAYKIDAPDRAQIVRLQLDARKWITSKIMPKKYGDRLTTDNTTTVNASDSVKELMKEIWASGSKIHDPRSKSE